MDAIVKEVIIAEGLDINDVIIYADDLLIITDSLASIDRIIISIKKTAS